MRPTHSYPFSISIPCVWSPLLLDNAHMAALGVARDPALWTTDQVFCRTEKVTSWRFRRHERPYVRLYSAWSGSRSVVLCRLERPQVDGHRANTALPRRTHNSQHARFLTP